MHTRAVRPYHSPALRNRGMRPVSFDGHVVVGAGPVGLALSIAIRKLLRRPCMILERRSSLQAAGTSFNLTLVPASVAFLNALGVDVGDAVEIWGREFWYEGGRSTHRYGLRPTDRLYSVPRSALTDRLKRLATSLGVDVWYENEVLDIGRDTVTTSAPGGIECVTADLFLFADGSNSQARYEIATRGDCATMRKPDSACYAVVTIDASNAAKADILPDRIHFSTSPGGTDIGIANADGSLSLLLERRTERHLTVIESESDAQQFIDGPPAELRKYAEPLARQLIGRPVRRFMHAGVSRWAHGRCVLVGDAACTYPPHLGLGLNRGLHDVASLVSALWNHDDEVTAITLYDGERAEHATRIDAMVGRLGAMLNDGRFGSLSWRVFDRVERWRERRFGYRSPYQRLVFDAELPRLGV